MIDNLFSNNYNPIEPYGVLAVLILSSLLVYNKKIWWKITQHYITFLHEAGHAFTGFLFGGKLKSVHLNKDGSGLTTSLLHMRFIPRFFTTSAGYITPAFAGGIGAGLYILGLHGYIMLLISLTAISLLIFMRTWFGLFIIICLLSFAYVSLSFTMSVVSYLALLFIIVSVMGSMKDCFTRLLVSNHGDQESDAFSLFQLTGLPIRFWWGYFSLINTGLAIMSGFIIIKSFTAR